MYHEPSDFMPFLDCIHHSLFYATVNVRYLYPTLSSSIFDAFFGHFDVYPMCNYCLRVFAFCFEILFHKPEMLKRLRTSIN